MIIITIVPRVLWFYKSEIGLTHHDDRLLSSKPWGQWFWLPRQIFGPLKIYLVRFERKYLTRWLDDKTWAGLGSFGGLGSLEIQLEIPQLIHNFPAKYEFYFLFYVSINPWNEILWGDWATVWNRGLKCSIFALSEILINRFWSGFQSAISHWAWWLDSQSTLKPFNCC